MAILKPPTREKCKTCQGQNGASARKSRPMRTSPVRKWHATRGKQKANNRTKPWMTYKRITQTMIAFFSFLALQLFPLRVLRVRCGRSILRLGHLEMAINSKQICWCDHPAPAKIDYFVISIRWSMCEYIGVPGIFGLEMRLCAWKTCIASRLADFCSIWS